MKGSIKIFLMAVIVIGIGNVAFAHALAMHTASKIKKPPAVLVVEDHFEISEFEMKKVNPGVNLTMVAVLPEPVIVPAGSVEFIKEKKSVYRSPHINKKWVWYYSLISNM